MTASPSATVLCLPWLDAAAADALVQAAERQAYVSGQVGHGGQAASLPGIRQCELCWGVDADFIATLAQQLLGLCAGYGFELHGLDPADPPAVMRYREGGHFDWHLDNAAGFAPVNSRKLSFTLQLSPPEAYEGGDLEIAPWADSLGVHPDAARRAVARQQGQLIVFPSFLCHRVLPVTRGTRHALVGWLHGPPFR
jgi:PKHD-type hydroxylase